MERTQKRKRIIAIAVTGTVLLAMLLLTLLLWRPLVRIVSDPASFRDWIEEKGVWGPLIYIGSVILQVIIALIPGEPFEIAGGYAFGAIWGTLYALIGATVGGMLVFFAVRRFGVKLARTFFSQEKLDSLRFLQSTKRRDFLFFLIFMIPGTPKDLLSYFAGLTKIKPWTWLLISSVGRLPSLVTSTVGGDALGSRSYLVALIVFAATLLVSIIGLLICHRICTRRGRENNQ